MRYDVQEWKRLFSVLKETSNFGTRYCVEFVERDIAILVSCSLSKRFKDLDEFCLIDLEEYLRESLSKGISNLLFRSDLSSMPLLINHPNPAVGVISKWRLFIGK
jgi:hypothetical protein